MILAGCIAATALALAAGFLLALRVSRSVAGAWIGFGVAVKACGAPMADLLVTMASRIGRESAFDHRTAASALVAIWRSPIALRARRRF